MAVLGSDRAEARSGQKEASALATLFERTCLLHAGDADSLRAQLAQDHLSALSGPAAAHALARPGLAFAAPGPGHLMVLSFDDGWCGTGGTAIDPHALTLALADTTHRHDLSMRLMGAGADGREQRYLLVPSGPAAGLRQRPTVLLVLMQPEMPGTMQANLVAAPLPPDPPETPGP
jgi:hypothetical protein